MSGHWRSKPGGGESGGKSGGEGDTVNNDNASYEENNTEDFSQDNTTQKYEESEEYKKEYREREKQKSIERKDPDEIAGVQRGEPKTFYEMMQQGVNPNYSVQEDINGEYSKNCQSCNVACELLMRGYDVEANPYNNPTAKELGKFKNSAYINPATGKQCIPEQIDLEKVDCYDYIDETVKVGERYEFSYSLTPDEDDYYTTDSHTVFMTRMDNGKLLIYDGQNGEIAYDNKETRSYIESHINEYNTVFSPRLLRVDDKKVNTYYTDKVVRASGKSLKH